MTFFNGDAVSSPVHSLCGSVSPWQKTCFWPPRRRATEKNSDARKRLDSLEQARNGRREPPHRVGGEMQIKSSRQKITADSPPVFQRKIISCPSQPEVPRLFMNVCRISVQSSNDGPQKPIVDWNHKHKTASTRQAPGDHAANGIQTWYVLQNVKCRDHVKRVLKETLFGVRNLESYPGDLFPRPKNGVLTDIDPKPVPTRIKAGQEKAERAAYVQDARPRIGARRHLGEPAVEGKFSRRVLPFVVAVLCLEVSAVKFHG